MGAKCERLGSYALLIFDCVDVAVVDRLALTGVDVKEIWIFQALCLLYWSSTKFCEPRLSF